MCYIDQSIKGYIYIINAFCFKRIQHHSSANCIYILKRSNCVQGVDSVLKYNFMLACLIKHNQLSRHVKILFMQYIAYTVNLKRIFNN